MKFLVDFKHKYCAGVYRIWNIVDNRCYVGSTANLFHLRYKSHFNRLKNLNHHSQKLQRFANKYGIDKLRFEILEFYKPINKKEDKKYLLLREEFYITLYDSYRNGFNCLPKANSSLGIKRSMRTKKRLSLSHNPKKISQYSLEGLFIKNWQSVGIASLELNINKTSIRCAINGLQKTAGDFIWGWEGDNILQNIVASSKHNPGNIKRPILQIDENGNIIKEWASALDAAQNLNLDPSRVTQVCKKENSNTKGFKFKYKNPTDEKLCRAVLQFKINGDLIREFSSAEEAAEKLKIRANSIRSVCAGFRKTYKKYIWKYK